MRAGVDFFLAALDDRFATGCVRLAGADRFFAVALARGAGGFFRAVATAPHCSTACPRWSQMVWRSRRGVARMRTRRYARGSLPRRGAQKVEEQRGLDLDGGTGSLWSREGQPQQHAPERPCQPRSPGGEEEGFPPGPHSSLPLSEVQEGTLCSHSLKIKTSTYSADWDAELAIARPRTVRYRTPATINLTRGVGGVRDPQVFNEHRREDGAWAGATASGQGKRRGSALRNMCFRTVLASTTPCRTGTVGAAARP